VALHWGIGIVITSVVWAELEWDTFIILASLNQPFCFHQSLISRHIHKCRWYLNILSHILNRFYQTIHRPPSRLRVNHNPKEAAPLPGGIIHHEAPPYQLVHDPRRPRRIILTPQLQPAPLREIEAHLQARRRVLADQDEIGAPLHLGREVGRDVEGVVDLGLVAGGAVVDPAQRELETVAAPAALQREIGQVPDLAARVLDVEEVAGGERVGAVEGAEVWGEEEGAGRGHGHHLVRVDGEGIGQVRAGELVLVFRGEDGGPAPAGIDVEPEVVPLADGGDGFEGVVGAEDGGAGCGVHVEGRLALVFGLLD